jgi:hypothetical protein
MTHNHLVNNVDFPAESDYGAQTNLKCYFSQISFGVILYPPFFHVP